jgi:hypothetical protein
VAHSDGTRFATVAVIQKRKIRSLDTYKASRERIVLVVMPATTDSVAGCAENPEH